VQRAVRKIIECVDAQRWNQRGQLWMAWRQDAAFFFILASAQRRRPQSSMRCATVQGIRAARCSALLGRNSTRECSSKSGQVTCVRRIAITDVVVREVILHTTGADAANVSAQREEGNDGMAKWCGRRTTAQTDASASVAVRGGVVSAVHPHNNSASPLREARGAGCGEVGERPESG